MFSVIDHPPADHGNPFPASRLVEGRGRCDIWKLQKSGGLTPGAETAIRVNGVPVGSLRALPASRILATIGGVETLIPLTSDEPMVGVPRLWFQCPACQKRCRHIYLPELRCRLCLRLEHKCRHSGRWGNIHRVIWLRKRLGQDEQPFGALLSPQRRRRRYWQIAAQIAAEEQKLIGGLQRLATAAEKENQRDGRSTR